MGLLVGAPLPTRQEAGSHSCKLAHSLCEWWTRKAGIWDIMCGDAIVITGVFGWCWLTGEGCGARSGSIVSLETAAEERYS